MNMKKILIGEDSSVIQNLAKKILEFQNFKIDVAKNGDEVLKFLQKGDFDAVLLDINMPVMDGMECIEKIRGLDNDKLAKIPVVAITGNARNYTKEDFDKAGFNAVLTKPLNFDQLVDTVKALLD
jgi:CheY-like chemotaxis protein